MKKQIKNLEAKAIKSVKNVKGGHRGSYSSSFEFTIDDNNGGQP